MPFSVIRALMENQDELIWQLIRAVIQHSDGSLQQKQAIDKLSGLILKLPGIYRDNNPRINYQDALNQALANLVGVCFKTRTVSGKNIRRFIQKTKLDLDNIEPEIVREKLVKWFNKILKRRIIDLYRALKNQPFSLDTPMNADEGETTYLEQLPDLNLSGIEFLITEEELQENRNTEQKMKRRFDEELTEMLSCHPDGYPHCTCQELIRRRLLRQPPQLWKELAQDLQIPYGTVTSHWNRKCQPLLKQIPNLTNQ